jgi:hypothetical protein
MSGVSSGSFSSSLMVICCPLDFASISFSSSLAYVSEYLPDQTFLLKGYLPKVFPAIAL